MRSAKEFNTHWKGKESQNLALKEQQYQNLKAEEHVASGNELVDD